MVEPFATERQRANLHETSVAPLRNGYVDTNIWPLRD
jgi:hypothetical protein